MTEADPKSTRQPEAAPRVTVFIPAYNAARFIGSAIDSVLTQTWSDFELLVIDDGSTDETRDVLNRYKADVRLRVVLHKKNRGRPRSRNAGLELARGEYMALMDADDYCAPERLARQVAYLDEHPDIDLVGCLWSASDENGQVFANGLGRRQMYTPEEIAAQMLFCCPVHQPTIMARRDVLASYRYDTAFPVAQDHELWSRMARTHRFAVLPEVLMHYRRHPAQATARLDLIHPAKQRIQARQLAELGISFNARDVINHDHLFHFKGRRLFREQSGRELDLEFVRWARRWIEKLAAVNADRRIYPEPEFSRILGARWLFVCRKAAAGTSGLAVWRVFLASSLKSLVLKSVLHDMRAAAVRQQPLRSFAQQ